MKYISDMVYTMKEEIINAKEYAEKAIYYKSQGNVNRSRVYTEMANDELKHSKYVHEIIMEEVTKLSENLKVPESMREFWEAAHKEYVDEVAWIKQMLAM